MKSPTTQPRLGRKVDPAIQETALQTIVKHLNIKELSINQQTLKRLTVDTQKQP